MSSRTTRRGAAQYGPDWSWDFNSDDGDDAGGHRDDQESDSGNEDNQWLDVESDSQSGDDGDEDAIIKMPPAPKRRIDHRPKPKSDKDAQKEGVMLAYFNLLPARLQNTVILYASNLMKLEPKCRRWIGQNLPLRTQASMIETLSTVHYDQHWTKADEKALQDNWKKDPIRKDWWELDTRKQNRAIVPLWKTFSRLFGVLPDEVITREVHLEYGSKGNNWTAKFCTRLQNVAMHPMFGADIRSLTLGLLYVVMCRTDYRGKVPWEKITTDHFLSCFLQEMEKNDGSKTIVEARQAARQFIREQGSESSLWDLLFESIEKKTFVRKRNHRNAADRIPIFQITTEDLASLHKSLNTVKVLGLPVFWLVAIFSRLVKHSLSDWGAPRGRLELYRLRKGVELRKRRQTIIHERKQAAGVDLGIDLGIDSGAAPAVSDPGPFAASHTPAGASDHQAPEEDNWVDDRDGNQGLPALNDLTEDQVWGLLAKKLGAEAANVAKAAVVAHVSKVDISNDDDDVNMDIGDKEASPVFPPARSPNLMHQETGELTTTTPAPASRAAPSYKPVARSVPAASRLIRKRRMRLARDSRALELFEHPWTSAHLAEDGASLEPPDALLRGSGDEISRGIGGEEGL